MSRSNEGASGRQGWQGRQRGRRPHPHQTRPVHGHTQRDRNRRQFGQNFLRDRAAVLRIVDAAELRPDLPVVEAGPGEGLLTRELARRAREVLAYEIDPDMAEPLWQRFAGESNVRIVNRDFLTAKPPAESFAFVGAIPYGVTSAIVDWCLAARALVSATMVTQLEFARKRTGNYGRWSLLTVSTWPRFAWEFHGRIDRRLFRPVPRVDSAILRLARRDRPLLSGAALTRYETMVELCFSGVGGSVRASLRRMFDRGRIDAALGAAGIGRDTVVAFVHPNQWIRLFAELNQR